MFTKKDRKIANQKAMIKNRDELIETLKIVIDNYSDENKILKAKNIDLQNNIEILTNNLPKKIKKELQIG